MPRYAHGGMPPKPKEKGVAKVKLEGIRDGESYPKFIARLNNDARVAIMHASAKVKKVNPLPPLRYRPSVPFPLSLTDLFLSSGYHEAQGVFAGTRLKGGDGGGAGCLVAGGG